MDRIIDSFAPDIREYIDARVSREGFADAKEYLETLVRQDQADQHDDVQRLRDLIKEGFASGIVDREPEDILDEIVAEDPDLRG